MTDTPSLCLPLLQPSQAQKHVTVNEALIRLDGLTQLRLQSRQLKRPPVGDVVDGACYAVADGAAGEWIDQDGMIAIGSNGGWLFVEPLVGWRAWILDEGLTATFVNGRWDAGWVAGSPSNASARIEVTESTYSVASGAEQQTNMTIPADSIVFACSARVIESLNGTAPSWRLGISGDSTRFGSGIGCVAGSYCTGLLSHPTAIYAETSVWLAPDGGTFSGGQLRLALHCYRISLPE
ncbi:DUF2793 domain-containing protein [Tropicimonas isoalkanivorans]|uniref:Uncharacterized protein n=1 Tax=Tropicimonas isoalkanivorans TaxID=441112 RepID=A0A1I1E8A9_9RHOB|nr:DUF2793 domain-containing protein [Tropicimonas isoalkanivorans]SFB83297.1 Protein of unknown function [Tropicimonas isoalkanivorans]